MKPRTFRVTEQHLLLAKQMRVSWWGDEFGSPAIDCKRPYGNSDVLKDISKILGEPGPDEEGCFAVHVVNRYEALHDEMKTALQIFLTLQTFQTGVYETDDLGYEWMRRISD